jgi:outer membrane PBP1 activator LpoA protein
MVCSRSRRGENALGLNKTEGDLPMTTRRLVLTRSAALVGAASTGLLLPQIARAQGNKVRVGLMLPFTGTYAQLGVAIENGVRMAINEKGGKLGGREISGSRWTTNPSRPRASKTPAAWCNATRSTC